MDRDEAILLLNSGPKGVDRWNRWREKNPSALIPGLFGVGLYGSDLEGANLADIDLSGADLSWTRLYGANLSRTNLQQTDLNFTTFQSTLLTGADFSGAIVGSTVWADVDLSHVHGLEDMEHTRPSTLGIETLLRSVDLPDQFLSGCGIPETILDYVGLLSKALEPIQYSSCFISYSHHDEEFAERLHGRLRKEGLRVWYAPENIKGGQKIHHQIDQAIRLHDRLLLVLSEASMSSEWVATEIYKARQREITEGKQVLWPIRLVDFERIKQWECFDADIGKDMAREIREHFIPDFTDWQDQAIFEASFQRLLDDLKKSEEPTVS